MLRASPELPKLLQSKTAVSLINAESIGVSFAELSENAVVQAVVSVKEHFIRPSNSDPGPHIIMQLILPRARSPMGNYPVFCHRPVSVGAVFRRGPRLSQFLRG